MALGVKSSYVIATLDLGKVLYIMVTYAGIVSAVVSFNKYTRTFPDTSHKMLKLVFIGLVASAALAQNDNTSGSSSDSSSSSDSGSQQGNTRIFGLGNLLGGLTGRPNRPNRPFGGGFNQGGFGGGGFNQGGFGGGFNQGGFNQGGFNQGFRPGFNQGGFQPGFNQGGFNNNPFGNLGGIIGGVAAGLLGGRPPFQGGFNQFKPGQCPPVRPRCPDTRLFGAPQPCNNDFTCAGSDKCCFDSCLRERVCKPIQQFGR